MKKKRKRLKLSRELEAKKCRDPGLNRGPSDLQSDALPTEGEDRLTEGGKRGKGKKREKKEKKEGKRGKGEGKRRQRRKKERGALI